jgi:nicotinamide-nucleotide amidase
METVQAELFSVGTELTLGRIQDSNSFRMAGRLSELGVFTRRITVLSDDLDDVVDAFRSAMERGTDVIIASGGLGPTPDDRTVEALCLVAGRDSVIAEDIVEDYMQRRNVRREDISAGLLKMATIPRGADARTNPAGWAPCIRLDLERAAFFLLPGPPAEMDAVFTSHVVPFLASRLSGRTRSLRVVVDMFESEVSPLLEHVMERLPGVYLKAYVALRHGSGHGLPVDIVARGADETAAIALLRDAETLFARLVADQGKSVSHAVDEAVRQ